jgi:hypothetical protein
MSHFSFKMASVIVACLIFSNANAEDAPADAKQSIVLSYLSWNETVDLLRGDAADKASANLFGNSLTYEREIAISSPFSYSLQAAALFGFANLGATQTLAYRQSNRPWWGADTALRLIYNLSNQISTSIGSTLLYRRLDLPADASGTSAKSGINFNLATTADLRLHFHRNWELREEFGLLAFKASTYWSLGIACNF